MRKKIALIMSIILSIGIQFEKNISINLENIDKYIIRPNANWFENITFDFPRGSDARIFDIDSGREFYIRRTFGTNHADIEPLTKYDARIMYEIWGGFSWSRRAVLVYVGNYIFAGSLTNFPHAGVDGKPPLSIVDNRSGGFGRGLNFNAISGNGIHGHMCLHFYGSLTHVTNRRNPQHSAKISQARDFLINYR